MTYLELEIELNRLAGEFPEIAETLIAAANMAGEAKTLSADLRDERRYNDLLRRINKDLEAQLEAAGLLKPRRRRHHYVAENGVASAPDELRKPVTTHVAATTSRHST